MTVGSEKATMLYSIPALKMPKVILLGHDSLQEIGKEAKKLGGTKAIIITDRILVKLGLVEKGKESLEKEKIQVDLFEGIEYEPTIGIIEKALAIVRKNRYDFVVGFGGGAPWMRQRSSVAWRRMREKLSIISVRIRSRGLDYHSY